MAARLYEVKVVELRDDFSKCYVSTFHVAADNRAKAVKMAIKDAYTDGANVVTTQCKCLTGGAVQVAFKSLKGTV